MNIESKNIIHNENSILPNNYKNSYETILTDLSNNNSNDNILPSCNDYKKNNIINNMSLNFKWHTKENKIVLYKKVQTLDAGNFSFTFNHAYKDVTAVQLLKAKIYTLSTSNSYSEFFVLSIDELNKNDSDNINTHKLNDSFAFLDIDTHMEHSSSGHHHIYTNIYDINKDVKYFDPPLNSLNKLTCNVYKQDQSNILNDTTNSESSIPFNIRLEFIIKTKEMTRIY